MKKKKILIISLVLVVIIIIGIIIGIWINNIKKDNENLSTIMDNITLTYKSLEENIGTYNKNREDLNNLLDGYYSDMLSNDYDKYINILNSQEKVIKDIRINVEELDNNCNGRLFSKNEITKICNNYKDYYETVVNVYVDDENAVNDLIINYNNNSDKDFDEYHSSEITDYVDYNKDGKYLGRVE